VVEDYENRKGSHHEKTLKDTRRERKYFPPSKGGKSRFVGKAKKGSQNEPRAIWGKKGGAVLRRNLVSLGTEKKILNRGKC